jgi:hypothetical protein
MYITDPIVEDANILQDIFEKMLYTKLQELFMSPSFALEGGSEEHSGKGSMEPSVQVEEHSIVNEESSEELFEDLNEPPIYFEVPSDESSMQLKEPSEDLEKSVKENEKLSIKLLDVHEGQSLSCFVLLSVSVIYFYLFFAFILYLYLGPYGV